MGMGNLLAATTTAAATIATGPPGGRHKRPRIGERTHIWNHDRVHDRVLGEDTAKNTKAAPASVLSRGLEFEAIREFTHKAGVTCNNTPDTPTL
jgi:hypothetical protein